MKILSGQIGPLLSCVALGIGGSTVSAWAQPAAEPAGLTAEVFDALAAIEGAQGETYPVGDVQRIFRAFWWDMTYSTEEQALAKQLSAATRPIAITGADGRTLSFSKSPAPDAARQQRFLLPGRFSPNDSSYFVQAFRNTKDAGVFIGACRVHENAAAIMETTLNDMINQARLQAKTGGDDVITQLFDALEAGHRDANPAIQAEFADIVRRVVGSYSADPKALPAAVRTAAWLQPPGA